jgi:hypothetical protein
MPTVKPPTPTTLQWLWSTLEQTRPALTYMIGPPNKRAGRTEQHSVSAPAFIQSTTSLDQVMAAKGSQQLSSVSDTQADRSLCQSVKRSSHHSNMARAAAATHVRRHSSTIQQLLPKLHRVMPMGRCCPCRHTHVWLYNQLKVNSSHCNMLFCPTYI